MDLQLWEIAKTIKSEENTFNFFHQSDAEWLANQYLQGQLPLVAQGLINEFMETYGMRGLGEIDLGRKRWRGDPAYILDVIKNYLLIADPAFAPDRVFKEGERAAAAAIQELQTIARNSFAGRLKAKFVGYLAHRVRELAGLRESPKFFIIQLMGIIRPGMLAYGQQLVDDGKIDQAGDIFYLFYDELAVLEENAAQDWRPVIAERRTKYQNEMLRKQIPRLLLSDGRAFYEGISSEGEDAERIIGSPVSPGSVEGHVRVVDDPLNSGLKPGEIMVCQGTDPAWTPLFLTASGLIMEVGGMMTHGAIVAREYGIPAVVGISRATEILQTGRHIQLNGSTGEIRLGES
jgi:phosphohistidine swiveling domain-containing protein